MSYRFFLIIGTLLLTACTPTSSNQMGNGSMMGGNQGGMMDSIRSARSGQAGSPRVQRSFLPAEGKDINTFPSAKVSETIEIQDGDTITLNPEIVRATLNGTSFVMYGYNGQIPGPVLKVKQGSTFTVNVTNNIDQPTTVHWHGIRLANANDGVPGLTQEAIEPRGSFTYTVTVPDEGMFWYHPHVREDLQQDLGLYGNLWVTPKDALAYSTVDHEEVLILDDILLEGGLPVPYGSEEASHALMGRFGNVMLMNGSTDYSLSVSKGEVVRFFLTDVANTRSFKIAFGGAKMKLVGGDSGRYEKEEFVDSVIISPSERVIIDVLFEKSGSFPITHRTPDDSYTLGTVNVTSDMVTSPHEKAFASLSTHEDIVKEIDTFRPFFTKPVDKTLVLDMDMMGNSGMGGGMMMGGIPPDGIEWEDEMGTMNTGMMNSMMKWNIIDEKDGAANDKIHFTAKVGDKVKIRIINKKDSAHPMQHPIHFHGQRFLVLSDNGVENNNFVWKDTVLVPAGHTVDILLDASNPGDWMFHCHIAEHLSNGMMGLLKVRQ